MSGEDYIDTSPQKAEYVFLKCDKCSERIKLAKDKGMYHWLSYNNEWLSDFLNLHEECGSQYIHLEWR